MNFPARTRLSHYVIVENQIGAVAQLRSALERLGIPKENILPPASDGRTIGHTNAENLIAGLIGKGTNARERCVVLFLDIALDDDDRGFDEGIAWLKVFLEGTKDYVRILYSGATDQVQSHLSTDLYDGLLAKYRLRLSNEDNWRTGIVRSVINEATRKWQLRNPSVPFDQELDQPYEVEDNLALRMFQATFGKDALTEVIAEATKGAATRVAPEVKIASGGYSGSHVLLIRFANDQGIRRIAIKLDKRKEELEREVSKQKEVASAIEKWANVPLALVDGTVKEIPNAGSRMYFFSLPFFSGETLERQACSELLTDAQIESIKAVFSRLGTAGVKDQRSVVTAKCFGLTSEDQMRFLSSVNQVKQILPRLTKHASFRKHFASERPISVDPLLTTINEWVLGRIAWKFENVPAYEQHGDLNPRNILLLADGDSVQVRFIVFARCGVWSVGYDLQRLRLQLALRLLDSPDSLADNFHDRISLWQKAWLNDTTVLKDASTNAASRYGFANFLRLSQVIADAWSALTSSVASQEREKMEYAFEVAQLWDLIKMCSYQDAAWFKRVWFVLLAMQKARRLGLIS